MVGGGGKTESPTFTSENWPLSNRDIKSHLSVFCSTIPGSSSSSNYTQNSFRLSKSFEVDGEG